MTTMKNTTRNVVKLFIFVPIALATAIFPDIVNAHSYFSGNVTLPYEVRWGKTVLQPGDYFIRIGSLNQPTEIYSKNRKRMYFTSAQFTDLNSKGETSLTITAEGNKHTVNTLNMPFFGVSLIYKPLARIQRENTVSAHPVQEQVPVSESQQSGISQ
jgi:hypothetical protein